MFCVFTLCYCLVVNASTINCPERLVSEMTYYVSSESLSVLRGIMWDLCRVVTSNAGVFDEAPYGTYFFLRHHATSLTVYVPWRCIRHLRPGQAGSQIPCVYPATQGAQPDNVVFDYSKRPRWHLSGSATILECRQRLQYTGSWTARTSGNSQCY